jgi:hypothetical protein
MINSEKFTPFKEKKPVDLFEIYERTVKFLDENLPAITQGILEVLGDLQRNDLRTLIKMSESTDPPILHELTPQEIDELKKYIEESERRTGYTVDVTTLVSALTHLSNTLKARLREKKHY